MSAAIAVSLVMSESVLTPPYQTYVAISFCEKQV